MAPAYKLTYFDGRGIAEPIRYIFKYANLEFEDVRIKYEEWPGSHKDRTPFGKLPFLEHDGVVASQSISIARYIGKLAGIGGKTELENLQIDAMVDSFNDLRLKLYPIYFEQDPEKKKALIEQVKTEFIPFYFSRFDASIKKNNGFIAVPHLTWADFYIAGIIPFFKLFISDDITEILAKYPNFVTLIEKVENLPQIKKWIEVRPATPW